MSMIKLFGKMLNQVVELSRSLFSQKVLSWTFIVVQYETLCAIWYHFYHLKNVKNTHAGVLHLVKLQAEVWSLQLYTESNTSIWAIWVFFTFFINKRYQIVQSIIYIYIYSSTKILKRIHCNWLMGIKLWEKSSRSVRKD